MGYATGKTTLAVMEALSLAAVTHPGYEGIVAAPTFPLLYQSWVTEWRRWVPAPWYRLSSHPLFGPHIDLHTDSGVSRIWLRSTVDPKSLEGVNAAWLVFDEATRERSIDPIRVLAARIRRGYPGRQRRTLVIGPPSTRSHWTAQDYGTGPGESRSGDVMQWSDGRRAVVRGRTRDNPHLPTGYEDSLRTRPGASRSWCRQWLDAEFGAAEGQVYESFSRDVHIVPAASLTGRVWVDVIAGIDWGWSKMGVMLVLGVDGRGDVTVLHEEAHAQRNVDDTARGWLPIIDRVVKRFGVRRIFCDPSRPGDIDVTARKLRSTGALVYPADNDVGEGIRRLNARLEHACERATAKARREHTPAGKSALYISDACPYTLGEIEGYVHRRERDGSFSEQPEKRDDHAMDALRYAEMGTRS
jgi:hypothetical protein